MPNPYFRFKQFTIYQDQCAMKVGTDGVLLGAWTAVANLQQILDVGTGTGLLALMLAQRCQAQIDAVEIDAAACQQAAENFSRSPWAERIHLFNQSLQAYNQVSQKQYDLLVANPPFHPASLTTTIASARAFARQNQHLPASDLLTAADALLGKGGRLAVIYPATAALEFQALAEDYGFRSHRMLQVKPKHHLPVKRILLDFHRSEHWKGPPQTCQVETLVLEEAERYVYTPEFIALIKDFYLKY